MDDQEEVPNVVRIAAGIDGIPTLAEIDAMLHELHEMESSWEVVCTIDELLDLRKLLTDEAYEPKAA